MTTPPIERVHLPSRIRRGRLATSATWIVTRDGLRLYFARKQDAVRFAEAGCPQHDVHTTLGTCSFCLGRREP